MNRQAETNVDLRNANIRLFHNLPSEYLQAMSGLLSRKTFPASVTLMTAEQVGEAVYFILSGTVKIHIEQEDGSDVIMAILGPGEIVGEMSVLGQTIRSASVVTIESCVMLWMDCAAFQSCLLKSPELSYNLACTLAERLRHANEKIETLATQSVESRVARQLVSFAEQYGRPQPDGGVHLSIRLTQGDIASLIGASREHINRVMVSYKERDYLSIDSNYHITIHNLQALARRC
jgi:CRP/FNR family transcriptional regulator, cyclic AMP receptor protein